MIYIISSTYPYILGNAEFNSLKSQIKLLNDSGKSVTIIPTQNGELNYSEYKTIQTFKKKSIVFFIQLIIECIKHLIILVNELKVSNILNFTITIKSYLKGIYAFTYLNKLVNSKKINLNDAIIYNFWFDDFALGSLLLKVKYKKTVVLIGAHGYDLYSERRKLNKIPFRETCIKIADKILVDSDEGVKYLDSKYPNYSKKYVLTKNFCFKKNKKTAKSSDKILRIVTVSRIHPVKRIPLLIKRLKEIEEISDFNLIYNHIGGGEGLDEIYELVKKLKFKKFKINLMGQMTQENVQYFFENNNIDVLINLSTSEGGNIAVIEALSYSVPVIVTKVGGNIKIGEYLGTLLKIDFSAHELGYYFKKIISNSEYLDELKIKSLKFWHENHSDFSVKNKFIQNFTL